MPIIAQLMTMKAQTRCLQLETYLWLYFGILGAEVGYGKFSQPGIPGGSTLIFEIELLGIG